jgi:hypothetical protein
MVMLRNVVVPGVERDRCAVILFDPETSVSGG